MNLHLYNTNDTMSIWTQTSIQHFSISSSLKELKLTVLHLTMLSLSEMCMYCGSYYQHQIGVCHSIPTKFCQANLCQLVQRLVEASYPGSFKWQRKRAWIHMFAHVLINNLISQFFLGYCTLYSPVCCAGSSVHIAQLYKHQFNPQSTDVTYM